MIKLPILRVEDIFDVRWNPADWCRTCDKISPEGSLIVRSSRGFTYCWFPCGHLFATTQGVARTPAMMSASVELYLKLVDMQQMQAESEE